MESSQPGRASLEDPGTGGGISSVSVGSEVLVRSSTILSVATSSQETKQENYLYLVKLKIFTINARYISWKEF